MDGWLLGWVGAWVGGWIHGWIEREVLINGIMVGSSGGGPKRISRVIPGVWGLRSIASFFRTRFFSNFFDVGSILGGFWEVKTEPKSCFFGFFFDVFFECVLASILGRFFLVFLRADLQNSCAHAVFC